MKLLKARITNFRSAEDSGEFNLDDVTCFVGKNEAGKTAILTALAGFDPHPSSPIVYEIERDYPRRFLNDYKQLHPDDEAQIVWSQWEIDEDEIEEIEEHLGEGVLRSNIVTGTRHYGDKKPRWNADVDYLKAIENILGLEKLSASERAQVGKPGNTKELRDAIARIEGPTEKHAAVIARLDGLPGKTIRGAVEDVLGKRSPYTMYFSHYDRMVGQIRLDTLQRRINREEQPDIESGELVFLDFLHFAGTSLDEINAAQRYEELNARCESASIKITDQLLEYWTQNPNLSIEVRVTKAEPHDTPPFNSGVVARARVRNDLHRMSVPFSERSAGFIWFFSFLVKFAEVKKTGEPILLILDEPGLTLHGTAQADLLRYFDEKLAPFHQLAFSTHSPFMVPADKLENVRIVEDRIYQKRPGVWTSEGTKVREDSLSVDRDTLFPLQGALGYEITQTLFVGAHTLLVEGPSDILYLQAWSEALRRRGRKHLSTRWTVCPAGGIDKIQSFVSLFRGTAMHIAALTDIAKGDKKKLEALKARNILEDRHLLTYATITGAEEADVEDIFTSDLYADILNQTYSLKGKDKLTGKKLDEADPNSPRLVKRAEAAMRLVSASVDEFDHFSPASWLIRHPQALDADVPAVNDTLDKAEQLIEVLNALLSDNQ